MHNLTAFILLCCTFGMSLNLSGQNFEATPEPLLESDSFPVTWLGSWEGELHIYSGNNLVQSIPMALEILPIDTSENFVWAIIYGEDKEAGRRAYELETVDATKGFYRIDEKNSIKLESYLYGDKLYCQFSVMNSQITCTYMKAGDEIHFEIISGSIEPVSITGGETFEEEEIPLVKTYPVSVVQKAVLYRKK